ncbi:MAG: MarR family transcriptional regulator [Bacteroidota bacterium]
MKIETAIHQTRPFRNNYQKGIVNLLYSHSWLMEQLRDFFHPFDLTIKQFNVLRILKGAGEAISTSTIRERMIDKMSDASRVVNRLYKKGLVEKQDCPRDKRLVDVVISEKGLQLLVEIEEKNQHLDHILGQLDSEEIRQFNNLLDKIRLA